jgi:hypothetical protein
METVCWLPPQELFENYDSDWKAYEAGLYSIFKADFIDSKPMFENKQVNIRKHPMEYDKEEAFFHVTCYDFRKDKNRIPDFRRCERIRWVRSFIENYNCDPTNCPGCDGVKVWEEPAGTNIRVHLLLEEERYLVVIEKRANYCLLVTAFYIEYDHSLEKRLSHYEEYHKKA